MPASPLLGPVVALVAWTIIMFIWMYITRLAAMNDGKAYSVWKGSTYIQPARWSHDVVLEDGTVLRAELLTAVKGGY